MKYALLIFAALCAFSQTSQALTCMVNTATKTYKSSPVDKSDIKVVLPNHKFVWISGVGSSDLSIFLMRPATQEEKDQWAREGWLEPVDSTGIAHATIKGTIKSFSIPLNDYYLLSCEN